jgi:hypothetical protein
MSGVKDVFQNAQTERSFDPSHNSVRLWQTASACGLNSTPQILEGF